MSKYEDNKERHNQGEETELEGTSGPTQEELVADFLSGSCVSSQEPLGLLVWKQFIEEGLHPERQSGLLLAAAKEAR